jgi:hypothetical protein
MPSRNDVETSNTKDSNTAADLEFNVMTEDVLKKMLREEAAEIQRGSGARQVKLLASLPPRDRFQWIRGGINLRIFFSGSAVGAAVALAAVFVFAPILPIGANPPSSGAEDAYVVFDKPVQLARGIGGGSTAEPANEQDDGGTNRVIELDVENPLTTAIADAQRLVADGVKIHGLIADETTNRVLLRVPVVTESEVFFLEQYDTAIRREGHFLRLREEEITAVYRMKP